MTASQPDRRDIMAVAKKKRPSKTAAAARKTARKTSRKTARKTSRKVARKK